MMWLSWCTASGLETHSLKGLAWSQPVDPRYGHMGPLA